VAFFQKFVKGNNNDTVTKVVGKNLKNPGIEAELDVQYIMGVAPNIPTWFISVAPFDFWNDLLVWVGILGNTTGIPYVHSVSYGDQNEDQPTPAYKFNLAAQVAKLAARGLSVIFASGDSGTGCFSCSRFQPSFPATIPYVTSVGATHFLSGTSGPEGAVVNFGSGGGFSNHFTQPAYQTAAIAHYFTVAQDLPQPSYYNKTGRGTPDVSALGNGFQVIVGGRVQIVGGTSASSPTFAAIVSLLNERRFAANKPALGFLNPFLYQTAATSPTAFFDVVVGDNPSGCCHKGFPTAPGWDPVTGVGTPNYEVLKTLV